MKKKELYKPLFIVLIVVLGLLTMYAVKQTETPRFVLFLGRFHPLLLHLPIGALVVTFFIDVLGRFQKKYNKVLIRPLLGFTAFFSIFTSFLGYFLSLEGGYESETLDLHLYTGIGTAVITTLLFWLSLQANFERNKLFFPLFICSLITISVAGHYGSTLTHGESFLTEYATSPPKEKTIEVVDSLRLYSNVVAKILDHKCVQCHNASKQKGELSLITPETILKGGVNGANIIAGNASASLLYTRMLLPISDKEHMPPEGKQQLTKDEIWLVQHWINSGADFENYAAASSNDTLSTKLEKYLVFNEVIIPKASKSDINKVREAGYRVFEIVPNEGALNVKFTGEELNQKALDVLKNKEEQIVELDFHSTALTDQMTKNFNDFENLKYLRINSAQLTDKSLKNFNKLEQLESLNLFNTQITNQGLTDLLEKIQPQRIFSGNTKVEKIIAQELAARHNILIQNNIIDGFVEVMPLEFPIVKPDKTLFADTIHLSVKSRLKDVALHYTLDNSEPDQSSDLVNGTIVLDNSSTLKVIAYKDGWLPSETLTRSYAQVTDTVVDFNMKVLPDDRYATAGNLFNLQEGSLDFTDGDWVGYFGKDLETTIDLGSIKKINNLSFNTLEDTRSWIFYPQSCTVYAATTKNGRYTKIGSQLVTRKGQGGDAASKKVNINIANTEARFFKIKIDNYGKLPEWHDSAGNPAWLFIDEIYFW